MLRSVLVQVVKGTDVWLSDGDDDGEEEEEEDSDAIFLFEISTSISYCLSFIKECSPKSSFNVCGNNLTDAPLMIIRFHSPCTN